MQEIKCPNCGGVFQVDESGYQQIAQQVRNKEFEKELARREEILRNEKSGELKVLRLQKEQENQEAIAQKDNVIAELRAKLESAAEEKTNAVASAVSQKELEQERLRADALEKQQQELSDKNKRIAELEAKLESAAEEKTNAVASAVSQKELEQERLRTEAISLKNDQLIQKEEKIRNLEIKLKNAEIAQKLAVAVAVQEKDNSIAEMDRKITQLQSDLSTQKKESELESKKLHEEYAGKLRLKDEEIAYYKDFKARQSTKMVGESLEQHCETQFNSIRMTAFPRAYFEKDNDAKTGSKGDFIFRECAEDGTEFISIMFEMKNEMDTTATKHKNEDFFKKLDKDRTDKGCEYAVLVSLLEGDSELYNTGIVDVSYKYPKMYVIRPQFFIPLITLLRNAALNSLKYQQQLAVVRSQQIDVSNFEANMDDFKEKFGRNFRLATEKFQAAIDEIDKTIAHLQKTKDALLSSENNLRLANNKAEELSIKKLTKNAPSVREMFEEQKKKAGSVSE